MPAGAYTFSLYDRANGEIGVFEDEYGAFDAKSAYRGNRATQWQLRFTSAELAAFLAPGERCLRVVRNSTLVFNGLLVRVDVTGDANQTSILATFQDPMVWWPSRPVRMSDGSFFTVDSGVPGEAIVFESPVSGGSILQQVLQNSVSNGGDPGDMEGSLGLELEDGTVDTIADGAPDLAVTFSNWPLTIAELAGALIQTGALDVYITPVDETAGYADDIMGVFNAVTQRGSDRTADVTFAYATGAKNAAAARYSADLAALCNKLWYYLGPKNEKNAAQWAGNLTPPADSAAFDDLDLDDATLEAARQDSLDRYGTWMDVQVFDDNANENSLRYLYGTRWQTETLLRLGPRRLLHLTPSTKPVYYPFDDYNIGDLISVATGAAFGVEIAAAQRIYGFDLAVDDNGVERVSELIVSADQEPIS